MQKKSQSKRKPTYYPIKPPVNFPQHLDLYNQPKSNFSTHQLQTLRKSNTELLQKQQLYIQKLMKLQEGLQKQHGQFMELQEMYTEMLIGYKNKEEEIQRCKKYCYVVELLFRETQRKMQQGSQYGSNTDQHIINGQSNSSQQKNIPQTHTQLTNTYQTLNTSHQRLLSQHHQLQKSYQDLKSQHKKLSAQLSYYRSRQKMNDSMATLQSRVLQQLQGWQKQIDGQMQEKIKLQYENEFLKTRNQDLQKGRDELEKVLLEKQREIGRLREEKIGMARQVSVQRLDRSRMSASPKKQVKDSRIRQRRVLEELRKENQELKNDMKSLKDKFVNNYLKDSKELQFLEGEQSVKSPKSAEFFSFSRDLKTSQPSEVDIEQSLQNSKQPQQLPAFPPQLQIENLIEGHKK